MILEQLISEGETVKKTAEPGAYGIGMILRGEELERFAAKSVIYMEENAESQFLLDKVRENAKDLNKKGYEKCEAILGILKAIKETVK
jgi:hypothetical protein